jgi:hypothetical protein
MHVVTWCCVWICVGVCALLMVWGWLVHQYQPLRFCIAIPLRNCHSYHSQQFQNTVSTGSVVLFGGGSKAQIHLRAAIRSYFDHCSILINSPTVQDTPPFTRPKLLVWESDVGQYKTPGTRIIPLEKKLKRWKGWRFFVLLRCIGPPVDETLLETHILKYAGTPLHTSKGLFKYFFPWLFSQASPSESMEERGVFCSELVYQCLSDVGLVRETNAWGFSPGDFLKINEFTTPGVSYAAPEVYYF